MLHTIERVHEREGEYYVARTRVPVGVIIAAWQRHTPPEHIVEQFPTLRSPMSMVSSPTTWTISRN